MFGKSTEQFARSGLAVILVLLMCSSSAVGAVSVGSSAPATVSDDQFVSATDNISFWERSALPFRVDASQGDTVVDNKKVHVNLLDENTGDVSVNKQQLAVFNRSQNLTFNFASRTGAGTEGFHRTNTELVVAKLDGDASTSRDLTGLNLNQARNLLTSEDANQNATFHLKDTGTVDSDGSLTVHYDLSKTGDVRGPGHYVFFLVKEGGFEVTDGDLSVTNDAQVIGFDTAAVQHSPARSDVVNKKPITPGQEVVIDVESDLPGDTQPEEEDSDSLHQVLVVYHEDTFTNANTVVEVEGELNKHTSADNVTVKHDIARIEGPAGGVATNQKPVSIAGVTIGDGVVDGPTSVGTIFDFIADRSSGPAPENEPGDVTLHGFVLTAANQPTADGYPQSGDFFFTPTDDWKRGEYRYVYLTGNNSSTGFATDTGTFKLEDSNSNDNDNDNSRNRRSSDRDDSGSADSPPSTDEPAVTVSTEDGSTHVNIDRVKANSPVRVDFPSPVNGTDASVDGLEFNFSKDVENFSTTSAGLSKRPDNIVSDPTTNTLSYFSIDISGASDDDINRADISFTVSQEKLNSMSASPSEVRLYRYHNGHWQELETTYLGNGKFSAQTPGFSVFAVGITDDDQQSTTETPDGPGEEPTDETSSTETPSGLIPVGDGSNPVPFAILILLIVAAVVGAAYYQRTQ